MRHASVVALATLIATLSATAASAGGPVITFANDPSPQTIIDWGDCPTFRIDATFMAERRNETFYDDVGNPVLQRRHVSFTGTLYNATDPSKSVTYSGDFTRTHDYAANTVRITGLNTHVIVPGSGVIYQVSGEFVIDLESGDNLVSHGPDGSDLTQLCKALA
jgi:hypothetical protein